MSLHFPCEAMVQGGEDAQDAVTCRSLSAKGPIITGLFCGKRPIKIKASYVFLPPCNTSNVQLACGAHEATLWTADCCRRLITAHNFFQNIKTQTCRRFRGLCFLSIKHALLTLTLRHVVICASISVTCMCKALEKLHYSKRRPDIHRPRVATGGDTSTLMLCVRITQWRTRADFRM